VLKVKSEPNSFMIMRVKEKKEPTSFGPFQLHKYDFASRIWQALPESPKSQILCIVVQAPTSMGYVYMIQAFVVFILFLVVYCCHPSPFDQ
jgi:hypothetical protein